MVITIMLINMLMFRDTRDTMQQTTIRTRTRIKCTAINQTTTTMVGHSHNHNHNHKWCKAIHKIYVIKYSLNKHKNLNTTNNSKLHSVIFLKILAIKILQITIKILLIKVIYKTNITIYKLICILLFLPWPIPMIKETKTK